MARKQKSTTFKQTKRIKRMKRKKRDRRGETWLASIDRRSSATLRPSVTFYERCSPLSLRIIFSPRSFEMFAKANVQYNIRVVEMRVEQIKETKERDEESDLLLKYRSSFLFEEARSQWYCPVFILAKYSPGIYLIFIVALSIFFIVPPHFPIGDVSLLEIEYSSPNRNRRRTNEWLISIDSFIVVRSFEFYFLYYIGYFNKTRDS